MLDTFVQQQLRTETSGGAYADINEQEPPRQPATSLRAISTVDALIALQGVENPTERKKRAVAKGRNALDVLDALKLGFLDGSVDQRAQARLPRRQRRSAVAGSPQGCGRRSRRVVRRSRA
jgi:Class II flagellar assembly regulator